MKIVDYLKEDRITLDLAARTKEDAIKELASLVEKASEIKDFKMFLKDIFERENMATTGIGHEVALPHARTDAVSDFIVAFGRSSEGVDFKSIDQRPAKIFFLIGTLKEKKLTPYLTILARLSRLLEKESFRNELLKAREPKDIIDIFKNNEQ